jgi:hypothetical protein
LCCCNYNCNNINHINEINEYIENMEQIITDLRGYEKYVLK